MRHLHLDFETAGNLDLKDVGLYRYIEDASFRPLCVAWKVGNEQVRTEILEDV